MLVLVSLLVLFIILGIVSVILHLTVKPQRSYKGWRKL